MAIASKNLVCYKLGFNWIYHFIPVLKQKQTGNSNNFVKIKKNRSIIGSIVHTTERS